MASESSSAVLDMNDADTDETEASITEDKDAPPLIMEHSHDIAVKVDAPMKQLSTLETYVTYRVRCVCARWPPTPPVRRRYNHFKILHKRLSGSHPWTAVPPPPPLHTARQQLDRYSPTFVALRTKALNAFLDRIVKHPIFTHSEDLKIFLTTPDEELDKVFRSENNAMNLWGLGNALYGSSETKPSNGARVKDPEWVAYSEYLQSLQQKLITLCTLTTKLYKGSAALSTELMNMKRACDAWSCQVGGRAARGAGAVAAGAGGAAGAGAAGGAGAHTHAHRAVLPLLAGYTAAHNDKIKQRDALHAAYVAGTNSSGEMHNKLEQASEALRSELADWLPKTRSDIKSILVELADRQVAHHTHTLLSWERALRLSNDGDQPLTENIEELFKTVSKTAVQNLSPSKCRPDTPTERDLDDLDSNDSDLDNFDTKNWPNKAHSVDTSESVVNGSDLGHRDGNMAHGAANNAQVVVSIHGEVNMGLEASNMANGAANKAEVDINSVHIKGNIAENDGNIAQGEGNKAQVDVKSIHSEGNMTLSDGNNAHSDGNMAHSDVNMAHSDGNIAHSDGNIAHSEANKANDPLNAQVAIKTQDEFINDILEEETKIDSMSLEKRSKSDVTTDPLREFSDVDLS